jgi:hypothetical protein
MLFEMIVKGFVSLISFSVHMSLVYRRAVDFCELILYPASLLKVDVSCRSSLVGILGWLMFAIVSFADKAT